jgi:hypothetical protein
LQNFSNLRATRTVTPGRLSLVTRKELSAVVAECAARTERAAAISEEARAGIEVARKKQEEAIARQEAISARQGAATERFEEIQSDAARRNKLMESILAKQDAMLEEMKVDRARVDAEREDEKVWREESIRRQEKMFQDFLTRADAAVVEGRKNTEKILAIIADQSEDIRAMKDAILKLIGRFPPPPPHLRSA